VSDEEGAAVAMPGRWPMMRVTVSGSSMSPTLEEGDWLLCRVLGSDDGVKPGDIVVVRRPDRPELLLVKRAVRRQDGGWWVEGDNTDASDDSRVFGAVPADHVLAKAVARYLPSPRRL
jgi:nickel-type superoxide dismutase maturation protease